MSLSSRSSPPSSSTSSTSSSLRRALLLVTAAALPLGAAASPEAAPAGGKGPWELVRSEHGVVVHRRAVAGSNLHEFRGVAVIEAPIATVLAVLDDSEHRKEWMKEAVVNTRIEKVGTFGEIFYSRTGAPWPVSDRDVVSRAVATLDPVAHQVRIDINSTTHPARPEVKGVVRMPFLRGHWYLWPEHGGAFTRAEYQVHANPGGSLPDWLVNLVSKKIPFETLEGMRRQVTVRHYPEFEKTLAAMPEYQAVVSVADTAAR